MLARGRLPASNPRDRGKAWAALGYRTWEEYVRGEFNMSRFTGYRLLDQGRVIREIGDATGSLLTDVNKITDAEARDIKPVLPQVTNQIRDRVADLGPHTAAPPGPARMADGNSA